MPQTKGDVHMYLTKKDNNLITTVIILPDTNQKHESPSIIPERFTSISEPQGCSIVPPELGSVSAPVSVPKTEVAANGFHL